MMRAWTGPNALAVENVRGSMAARSLHWALGDPGNQRDRVEGRGNEELRFGPNELRMPATHTGRDAEQEV